MSPSIRCKQGTGPTTGSTIGSFTASNTGSAVVTSTVTVTPTYTFNGVSCTGPSQTFTISVRPTATMSDPADQAVCNGGAIGAITFAGTGATSFSWTNDNTSIGLAASGTGNIAGFTAVNNSAVSQVATVTVTPFNGTCAGTPQTFTLTVHPTATMSDPADQSLCAGAMTAAVNFTGTAGAVYNWGHRDGRGYRRAASVAPCERSDVS